MFRKDKKLFITLILMFLIVASLILITWLYEGRNREYEDAIAAKDKTLNSITMSYGELKEENKTLTKTVKELKEENELLKNSLGTFSTETDFATYQQILNDLSDISLMIKEGNKEGAKEELLKINPSGFDNTALSFYESLCRELNVKN